jgi:RNA polymerase sigma factor (sigma-70 family)
MLAVADRNQLVAANLGLAGQAAIAAWRRLRAEHLNVPYDDLYQEACLALMRAVESYDSAKSKLSTYSRRAMCWRMRQYLVGWFKCLRNTGKNMVSLDGVRMHDSPRFDARQRNYFHCHKEPEGHESEPLDDLLNQECLELLPAWRAKLLPHERLMAHMIYEDGRSLSGVARELGVGIWYIKRWHKQLLRKLLRFAGGDS